MKTSRVLLLWIALLISVGAIYIFVFNPEFLDKLGITENSEQIVSLVSPSPSIRPSPTPQSTKTISRTTSLTVDCTNCAEVSQVQTTPRPTSKPTSISTGYKITAKYNYTPDYYSLLNGEESYPNELIYAILDKQELGHLQSQVSLPGASYSSEGKQIQPGVYVVKPEDVRLTSPAAIKVNFAIRIPTLNNTQFEFLRDKKDYRFVYGLIRGIVGHEEQHFVVLKQYVDEAISILNNPLLKQVQIAANSDAEFQQKINSILQESVTLRLAAAQKVQEDAQDEIDNADKGPRITFTFQEPGRNGDVPATIIGKFKGKGTFEFDLPNGQVPRPPKPNIVY